MKKEILTLIWSDLLFIIIVAVFDGNQYAASGLVLGFHPVLAVLLALLVVTLAIYAAFNVTVTMQRVLLVAVIIFSMMAYIPRVTKLIEKSVTVELPNIRETTKPDDKFRVPSKNEEYVQSIKDENANIKIINDLEIARVKNINATRTANALTEALALAVVILIFGTLLPYCLYLGSKRLAEKLKFIQRRELKKQVAFVDMRQLFTQSCMDIENSMAALADEFNKRLEEVYSKLDNKALSLTSVSNEIARQREKKAREVLRTLDAFLNTAKNDSVINYSDWATKLKIDRSVVTAIVKRQAEVNPEIRQYLPLTRKNLYPVGLSTVSTAGNSEAAESNSSAVESNNS